MTHFRVYLAVVAAGSVAYAAVVLRVHSLLAAPIGLAVLAALVAALAVVVRCWERAGERHASRGQMGVFADLHEARQARARTEATVKEAA